MVGGYFIIDWATNEDIIFDFEVLEIDEVTAVDLSTYTPYMSIGDDSGNELLDCDAYVSIGGTDDNKIFVNIPIAVLSPVLPTGGNYHYDIILSDGVSTIRYLYGELCELQGYATVI